MTATSDLSVDLNWLSILTLVVFVVASKSHDDAIGMSH